MAYIVPVCVNGTQTQSTATVRQAQPINNSSSVIHTAPLPFMVQRPQRRTGSKKSSCTGTPGKPNLKRFKPTEASHARMLLKIRKQADHVCLPPAVQPAQTFGATLATNSAYTFASIINFASDLTSAVSAGLKNTLPGFPVAEAAENNKLTHFPSVDSFVAALQNDFDIRVSPDLKGGSLEGAIIVIGESHHDPALKPAILRVLKHLRPERGDMLLIEGGAGVCENRILEYGIPSENCINLEENSADYEKILHAKKTMSKQLKITVQFIADHMQSTKNLQLQLKGNDALREFIREHSGKVPAVHMEKLNVLLKKCNLLINNFNDYLENTRKSRESLMFNGLKEHRMRGAMNIAIFGARHVVNFAAHMEDKMIFMMPRLIGNEFPDLKLPLKQHEEL